MAHKMGLAIFSIPNKNIWTSKKYLDKSGNTYSYVWIEDSTVVTGNYSRSFSSNIPYTGSNYNYYAIVKKSENTSFSTTAESAFSSADVPDNSWSQTVNIAEGCCTTYTKENPSMTCKTITQHTLAVGDIMYTDGALSSSHTGSKHNSPIGIVFYVGTTSSDKGYDANFKHGYVLALRWAGGSRGDKSIEWCKSTSTYATNIATDGLLTPRNSDGSLNTSGLLQSGETVQQYRLRAIRTDMDGLKHCRTAYSKDAANMTAINTARSHSSYAPMPTSSTTITAGSITEYSPKMSEWYVPSIGQYYNILKMSVAAITGSETTGFTWRGTTFTSGSYYSQNYDLYYSNCSSIVSEMNTYFNNKGLSGKYDAWGTQFFWTSTENFKDLVFVANFDGSNIYVGDGRHAYGIKQYDHADGVATSHWRYIRPVLCF